MNITTKALKNQNLLWFLLFVLSIGGIFSFANMSRLEDPEIKVKEAFIATVYPGASPHQVELEVTDVLEKSIRSMGRIKNIRSRSLSDISEITVELDPTVKSSEIEQMWDLLRRKVTNTIPSLPEGAQSPIVLDDFGDVYGMFFAMTSDGFSPQEMTNYAYFVQKEIESVKGVNRVELYGNQTACVYIDIKEDKMSNLGVHPAEVLLTLQGQNQTVYPGYFNSGNSRLRIQIGSVYKGVKDIQNLVIQGHEEDQLHLYDIATITKGYEQPVRNALEFDKRPSIGIAISMEQGENIIELGKRIENKFTQLSEDRLPIGIEFHKIFFQPEKVSNAISTFMINLIESVLIVIIVIMLTMGLRSGIIIGTSLIIIVLGSFLILDFFDGTLQRVSLASLIIAMGMLVDNAIVIVDGILVDFKKGIPKETALIKTAQKTALPLLGATLIAIIAFLPIFLSPDTSGEYVRDLFIVLAVSLLLSWLMALTHVPLHAKYTLKYHSNENSNSDPFDSKGYRLFKRVLSWVLNHRFITLGSTIGLLIFCLFISRNIKETFFPDLSYNQVYIEYKLPEGTRYQKVQKDLREIETYLLSKENIEHVATSLGGTPARYNLVRSITDPSMSYGEFIVSFTSPDDVKNSISELQAYLNTQYPDAYARIKRYNLMYKRYPIEYLIKGPDPKILRSLSEQAKNIMQNNTTVSWVTSDWEYRTPYLYMNYSQPLARISGVSKMDLSMALMSATEGMPIGSFYQGTQKLPIYLRSVDRKGSGINDLSNIPVWNTGFAELNVSPTTIQGIATGAISTEQVLDKIISPVPLKQAIKKIDVKWEDPIICRNDGVRAIKIACSNKPQYTAEEARLSLVPQLDTIDLPKGYSVVWEGEYAASKESEDYLFLNLPLGVILILTLLIALFKDFKKPIIILLSLPVAAIGIVLFMLLFNKESGFVAIVGALGLMGMMIKNAVVLIDEIERQVAQGKDHYKALIDATTSRVRPVMMASLTTILGMIPLVSDDMFGALAVTIMGGLLVGSIITLVIIPLYYSLFFRIKHRS